MKDWLGLACILAWSLVMYGLGWNIRDDKAVHEVAGQQKADMAAFKQLEDRYNNQSEALTRLTLESQNETQTITKYVDRVVERPIYRSDCFDDDGLRLANAALLGKASLGTSSGSTNSKP